MDSTQLLNFAMKLHQAGNFLEAERLYRQILQAEPGYADALHMLGVLAHQVGNNDLAVDYIGQALRLRPLFPAALTNLGIALKEQGKLEEAISSYRQALRLNPDHAGVHYNLGLALRDQGKLDEAITCYQQALRLKPDLAPAYNNLGNALKAQGKLEEAITSYRQALRLRPGYAEAYNNLGVALAEQGKIEEAITNYQQALRLKPDYAEAYNNLGVALKNRGKIEEAVSYYQQAVRLKPDYAEAHINLGNALQDQGRLEEAVTFHERALRLQPDVPGARCNLGAVLQQLGNLTGAEQAFRVVLRDYPRHADALWQLATLLRGKLPAADLAVIEQCLAEPDLSDADRAKLLFGLACVCDARSEYEQAAAHLRQANALTLAARRLKGQGYDPNENARFIDHLISAFTPAFFERTRGFGLQTERPVFIVGLPRSGTTLTEQILAAHSKVFGAGELPLARTDFQSLRTEPTEESIFAALPGLQRETVRLLAQQHLDQLSVLNSTAERVVDKMPENYQLLGLLATLFPKAKFIHCRRDLRDVAVSCWMTHFVDVRWNNDPAHIVARFRDYRRLMKHWRAVLPVSLLEINYEETVADLPGTARRLVEWCGLDWEPACLNFHQGTRSVRTASAVQVRQPVYMRSVARWRNYEQELGSLFAALVLEIGGAAVSPAP